MQNVAPILSIRQPFLSPLFQDWPVEYGIGLAQKRIWDQSIEMRKESVNASVPLVLTRKYELTGVARSTVYAPHKATKPDEQKLTLLTLNDVEYTRHPFYSSRKIKRKRVQADCLEQALQEYGTLEHPLIYSRNSGLPIILDRCSALAFPLL